MSRPENTKNRPPAFGDFNFIHLETTIPMYPAKQIILKGIWQVPPEERPLNWQTKYPEIQEPATEEVSA